MVYALFDHYNYKRMLKTHSFNASTERKVVEALKMPLFDLFVGDVASLLAYLGDLTLLIQFREMFGR